MGTSLRDLLRACPAPPVGRPRNVIGDAEGQWKGGAKSRESEGLSATGGAEERCACGLAASTGLACLSGVFRALPEEGGRPRGLSGLRPGAERTSV